MKQLNKSIKSTIVKIESNIWDKIYSNSNHPTRMTIYSKIPQFNTIGGEMDIFDEIYDTIVRSHVSSLINK